jgi:hypothetical protein
MDYFPMSENCTVFSIGSNGQFEFEMSVISQSKGKCQVRIIMIHDMNGCRRRVKLHQCCFIFSYTPLIVQEAGLLRQQTVCIYKHTSVKIWMLICAAMRIPTLFMIVHFFPWCLSAEDNVLENGRVYKSWNSILRHTGVKQVDFLKMDVESHEWDTLPYMLDHPEESMLRMYIS